MGLSGYVGAAAQDGLLEILAARRLQEQLQQQRAQAEAQQELQRQSLAQRQREHGDELGLRREQMGQQQEQFDATRRERRNIEGLQQMNVDRASWERENAPPPRDPIADHEAKARIDARFREPRVPQRDPIADHRAKAQIDAEFRIRATPDGSPSPYSAERAARTLQSVDELIGKVSRSTAGFGSVLAGIPETDARNFAAELNTLKANIAFNELTQMREASKTGGALGQVSNIELKLLESALGALDPGQSPENLRQQLQRIKESVTRFNEAKAQTPQGLEPMAPMTSRGSAALAPKRLRFDARGNPIP